MFDKKQTLKVKGVAIAMLVFHHLFYSEQRIAASGIQLVLMEQETLITIASCMRLCVWIFAFLSAYGLTIQYQKIGDNPSSEIVCGFMFKRWISLMRPYWIVYAITLTLSVLLSKTPLELFGGKISGLIAGAFAISDLIGSKMPVGAWWYMCFAQLAILSIPLLYDLCKKYGLLVLVGSVLILLCLGKGILSPYGGYYYSYLFVVIIGVLCAQNGWLNIQTEDSGWRNRPMKGIGLILASTACIWINYRYSGNDPLRLTKVVISVAAMLMCMFVHQYMTWKPLEDVLIFLGKHSGYIFLTHAFGYTYFPDLIFWNKNAAVTFLSLLLFGLVCAAFCEKISTYKWLPEQRTLNHSGSFSVSDTAVIKGVATIILLALHLYNRGEAAWSLFSYNPEWMVYGRPLVSTLVYNACGKICVDMFVIFSGYGLNHIIRTREKEGFSFEKTIRFAGERILKLMLNFWCVYIVFVGLFTAGGKLHPLKVYGTGMKGVVAALLDFLGLRDLLFELIPTATLNVTWWYVSAALLMYILFPLLRYLVRKKGRILPLLILLIINIYAPYATYRQLKTGCLFYLSPFYLGMLLSETQFLDQFKKWISNHQTRKLFLGIVVLIGTWWFAYHNRYWGELPHSLACLYVCMALFMGEHGVLRHWYFRLPFELIGKHSGNIFMFHTLFLFKYQNYVYCPRNPILILLWFATWMTAVSILFEFFKDITGINTMQKKLLSILKKN